MRPALVGRAEELARIRDFVAEAAERPANLLLSGIPGIGKTTLWSHAIETTTSARILAHRAVAAEASIGLATLSDLFVDPFHEVAEAVPAPRRKALEVALLLRDTPEGFVVDTRLLGLAILDVLRALSSTEPLLIGIDDLQWMDRSSSAALGFALRRLRTEPVGVLATSRVELGASGGAGSPWPNVPFELVRLGPLSAGAVFRVVSDQVGLQLSRPRLQELHERVDGNPLFAIELARTLRGPGGHEAALPATVTESLAGRLAELSQPTRDVLRVAAALRVARVEPLARALGEESSRRALAESASVGLVNVVRETVDFAHPLIPFVLLEQSLPWERREARSLAAQVTYDPEERARQLALAADAPNEDIAVELDEAASRARRRGALTEAAEIAELAVGMTVAEERRVSRLLHAAELERLAGDRHRAADLAGALVDDGVEGNDLADALFTLAQCRLRDLPGIVSLCREALAAVVDDDRRAAEIYAFVSWMQILTGDVTQALADARHGLAHAERTDDRRLLARAIARVAMTETWSLAETPGLLERGVELERSLDQPLEFHGSPRIALARRLVCRQRLADARLLLEAAEVDAASVGDEGTRGHLLFHLAQLENDLANWRAAVARARQGLELAAQLDDVQLRGMLLNVESYALALLGEVDEARIAIDEGLDIAAQTGDVLFEIQHRAVLGLVELSLGNVMAAALELADLPDRLLALGMREATDIAWPAAIEALIEAGDEPRARRYLETYQSLADMSRSPWAAAIASRSRGLIAASSGDREAVYTAFDRALSAHARAQRPFDEAWTLFCLGRVARRFRNKARARATLEAALAVFDDVGAVLWSERARSELARIAGRRPGRSNLTAAEMQTARLAASGMTNKEIAAQLFVSVHTVEAHLSSVYRKLDITSRYGLVAHVDELVEDAPNGARAG